MKVFRHPCTVQCENVLLCYGVTRPPYILIHVVLVHARTNKSFSIDRYSVPGEQGCNLNDSIAKERLKMNIVAFWKFLRYLYESISLRKLLCFLRAFHFELSNVKFELLKKVFFMMIVKYDNLINGLLK